MKNFYTKREYIRRKLVVCFQTQYVSVEHYLEALVSWNQMGRSVFSPVPEQCIKKMFPKIMFLNFTEYPWPAGK
jgi:hypothetical protein